MDSQSSTTLHEEPQNPITFTAVNNEQEKKPEIYQRGGDDVEKSQALTSTESPDEDTYPEGGLKAWSVVAGAWFANFSSMGILSSIAIFQAYTLTHQLKDHGEGTVGWIFSTYTFLTFFCGIYIGPLFDKYGPRWLVIAGISCIVGSMVAVSFCTEFYQFMLAFGILGGLGTSLVFTPGIAVVGHWFNARRGFATGVTSAAGCIGGIVFPLMLTSLFNSVGFGWATRVMALICLCCGLISVCFIRSRLPPAKNASAQPSFRIFSQIPFLLATISIFLLEFALFIPLTYIATYAQAQGFSQTFAYHLLPIMNAGSVFGRICPGYYADFVGPFNVCLFSILLSLLTCFCILLPAGHTSAGIIVFALLFGFGSGNSIAITPVCIGRLCKTQEYGRYYATTYTVVSFACLIGIPISGSIVQANNGSYTELIIFTGCIYIGSGVFMVLAKTWKLGWKNWLAVY